MYGGDDVNGVVLDLGSFYARAGHSGEDTPRCIFQTKVGQVDDSTYKIGESQINFYKDHMKILDTMAPDGSVLNFDESFKHLCDQIFTKSLQIKPEEHPILLSEPSRHNKENRLRLTEFMFEKYGVPAIYLSKSAALSGYSYARANCLVVDSGASMTTVTPVIDGIAQQKCMMSVPIAGDYLTTELYRHFQEKGIEIVPRFKVAQRKNGAEPAKYKQGLSPDITYEIYQIKEIIRDFKETKLEISELYFANSLLPETSKPIKMAVVMDEEAKGEDSKDGPYELPDGRTLPTDEVTAKMASIFFSSQENKVVYQHDARLENFAGIQDLVMSSINKVDIDYKRDLFANLLLSGGSTLLRGFKKRLENELQEMAPASQKIKLMATSDTERKVAPWIGGSILSSLGTFQQMWMSKQEYDEHGSILVERKCP